MEVLSFILRLSLIRLGLVFPDSGGYLALGVEQRNTTGEQEDIL